MNDGVVEVTAPSRLHFGMLSFGRPETRQFGGAGAMVDAPGLRIVLSRSAHNEAKGPLADRVRRELDRLTATGTAQCTCRVEVLAAPQEHVGLGVGTQLTLSLCAGLRALRGEPPFAPAELARWAARGRRSAVGVYGFALGGLIVEAGKLADEALAPLVTRVPIPAAWRFVLATPCAQHGLSGLDEERAFAELPPVPAEVSRDLCQELMLGLIPAVAAARYDLAGESLYRFGCMAGGCFSSRQGGPFNGPAVENMVQRIRALGVKGVGQSSWGPTVFALVADEHAAQSLAAELAGAADNWQLTVASANNCGALVKRV